MPLVKAGNQSGSQQRHAGPAYGPLRITLRGERRVPGAEQEDAQQAVSENMATFADEKVDVLEAEMADSEKVVQQRIQNAAGIVRGKPRARFDRNDDQPQDCGDPCLKDFVPI